MHHINVFTFCLSFFGYYFCCCSTRFASFSQLGLKSNNRFESFNYVQYKNYKAEKWADFYQERYTIELLLKQI